MKTRLTSATLAIATVLGLGIAPAFAGEGGPTDNPPQAWAALTQVQTTPSVATAQNGQTLRAYVTQSNHGTWLFAPAQNGND